jgi:hypothetical protein
MYTNLADMATAYATLGLTRSTDKISSVSAISGSTGGSSESANLFRHAMREAALTFHDQAQRPSPKPASVTRH